MKTGKENYISPRKLPNQAPSQFKSYYAEHDKYGGSKFSFGNNELNPTEYERNLETSSKENNKEEMMGVLTTRSPNESKMRERERNFLKENENIYVKHYLGHRRRNIYKEKNSNTLGTLNIHEDEILSSGLPSTKRSLLSETNSIQSSEKVLSISRVGPVHYSPKREVNDPTYDEMKQLLEITEQELFDASQRLKVFEKENSELAGLKCYGNSLENKVKHLEGSLGETVSLLKSVQTKLEQSNFENKSILKTFNTALELDAIIIQENPHNQRLREQKERLAQILNKEVQNINKISMENDLYIEAIAQLDIEVMKHKQLDKKGLSVVLELQKKVKEFQEQIESQEDVIRLLNDKIKDQEKLLNDQEGLKSTTRKIIELQKNVAKNEQVKEEMEKDYNLLRQTLQNKEEEFMKLEEKNKELEKKYLYSSTLNDKVQEDEEAEWNSIAKGYIKKIENELKESKELINNLQQENNILKAKEYSSTDVFGEKVGKINEDLKTENQALKRLLEDKAKSENLKPTLESTPSKNNVTGSKDKIKVQKIAKNKDHSHKNDINTPKTINPIGHQTILTKNFLKIREERSRLKKEVMDRLSEAFLGKNKLFSISDSAKKLIKDLVEAEVSRLLDINEKKVKTLKEKELNLLDILRVEIDRHVNTLRNFKQCLDPLYELMSLSEEIGPLELGKSELGRYALGVQKRRQEVFLAVKYAKETQQRLKSLWNNSSLFGKGNTIESDISFQEMYHSLETKLDNPQIKEQFKNQTPEEIQFLERRVSYLSERVESLTFYNHDLLQQLEKTKEQLQEIHRKHAHLDGSIHQTTRIKQSSEQAEISFSSESLNQFQKNSEDSQREGLQKSFETNYLSFEDAREMLMMQATMIEGWLTMIEKKA